MKTARCKTRFMQSSVVLHLTVYIILLAMQNVNDNYKKFSGNIDDYSSGTNFAVKEKFANDDVLSLFQ